MTKKPGRPDYGDATPEDLALNKENNIMRPKRETSSKLSTLAAKVLYGSKIPTKKEVKQLAASVLSQDETKGQKKKAR